MQGLARNTDPHTSHEAAAWFVESGAQARQIDKIMFVISASNEPLTATEIGNRCGLSQWQVCRRSAEMKKQAQIAGTRTCSIIGSKSQTWELRR